MAANNRHNALLAPVPSSSSSSLPSPSPSPAAGAAGAAAVASAVMTTPESLTSTDTVEYVYPPSQR